MKVGPCISAPSSEALITPAISVLSAVEGLEVISPNFKRSVIPLTLVILFLLGFAGVVHLTSRVLKHAFQSAYDERLSSESALRQLAASLKPQLSP